MTANLVGPGDGRLGWSMTESSEGYRDYRIAFEVETDDPQDGPATVRACPDLPLPGQPWAFGNDLDPWVWFRPDKEVSEFRKPDEGNPHMLWRVDMLASNRPLSGAQQRCQDVPIDDPLLEPPRVTGSFTDDREEAASDRWGYPIKNSAHEVVRGPQVEFDRGYPVVRIEQNVLDLQLGLLAMVHNTVNASPLWGFGPRQIKCKVEPWEKKYWGQCNVYYTRAFTFHANRDTWDRSLQDDGTMALNGHIDPDTREWILDDIDGSPPDPNNPRHFVAYTDVKGQQTQVVLDGHGKPWTAIDNGFYSISTTAVAEGGNSPFLTPEQVAGAYNGIVITKVGGGGGNTTATVRISGYSVPAVPDQFPISAVKVIFYTNQSGVFTGQSGGLIHEVSTDGTTWLNLETIVGNVRGNNWREYDITSLFTSWTWANIAALQTRIRVDITAQDPITVTADAVEIFVRGHNKPGHIFVSKYDESEFLLLGVPLVVP